ncbi:MULTISPECIES: hypothetical protein [Halomonas]|jgi:hypothetical protein|uniref:hypothetical protein n=1 Tax=Halomonas TaxID=2745 RepID=UPI0014741EC2|nr:MULTISPECIES: hypothetical protein [Halomonas]QJQ98436.1 hypothetical protein HIR79_06900 [Halomonas sp. PGE1]
MIAHCTALMGNLPWLAWVMPIAMLTLLGLGIAALAKYLFTSPRTSRDLPEVRS